MKVWAFLVKLFVNTKSTTISFAYMFSYISDHDFNWTKMINKTPYLLSRIVLKDPSIPFISVLSVHPEVEWSRRLKNAGIIL